jgi:hypothetical protein
MTNGEPLGQWVFLCYRMPREPASPRIAVWRAIKRLGVVQLVDGLVALPADPCTREQFELLADKVLQFGGEVSIWLAQAATTGQARQVAAAMTAARAGEYQTLISDAARASLLDLRKQRRVAARLIARLRRIERRDYFPPVERDQARASIKALLVAIDRATVARKAKR